jgi:hypothetical protein
MDTDDGEDKQLVHNKTFTLFLYFSCSLFKLPPVMLVSSFYLPMIRYVPNKAKVYISLQDMAVLQDLHHHGPRS